MKTILRAIKYIVINFLLVVLLLSVIDAVLANNINIFENTVAFGFNKNQKAVNDKPEIPPQDSSSLKFVKNKGQWCPNVLYRADLNNGCVFLEKNCFTYVFYRKEHISHNKENHPCNDNYMIRQHAYRMNFIDSRSLSLPCCNFSYYSKCQ
jgi:hypothetical protein